MHPHRNGARLTSPPWGTRSARPTPPLAHPAELTGSPPDAIKGAIGRASKTLHNLDWFEVSDIRGRIEDDARCHFQVTLKVGFRLDERRA
jgi:flavin-binding protein dodecin